MCNLVWLSQRFQLLRCIVRDSKHIAQIQEIYLTDRFNLLIQCTHVHDTTILYNHCLHAEPCSGWTKIVWISNYSVTSVETWNPCKTSSSYVQVFNILLIKKIVTVCMIPILHCPLIQWTSLLKFSSHTMINMSQIYHPHLPLLLELPGHIHLPSQSWNSISIAIPVTLHVNDTKKSLTVPKPSSETNNTLLDRRTFMVTHTVSTCSIEEDEGRWEGGESQRTFI